MDTAFQRMDVGARPLGDHAQAAGVEAIERVLAAAEAVRGMRVLHISMAGAHGSVPDQLSALLPLAADVGVQVDWRVLFGGPDLTAFATQLRQGLQGGETAIDDALWRSYIEHTRKAAEQLADDGAYDTVVLHDPATLGLVEGLEGKRVLWRCHVDASHPDPPAWERASGLAEACAAIAFPHESFAPPGPLGPRAHPIAPAIDPLSPRNLELAPLLAGRVLRQLGLDLDRPLCSQVIRLDGWKDPHTTLEAFALVRGELSELQLVIACELDGDASGWAAVKEISEYAAGEEDFHLLTSYSGKLGNLELGALNQLSRLAVRMSLREGFGLAASEALWRGTPVVGSRDGGTPLQVRDGIEGYLVGGAEETAERIVELVSDPGLAIEMGRAGRERVREHFLITRALEDELRLLASF